MQDVGNFGITKKCNGSEMNTIHHKKNGCKITRVRRWKPKPRSHIKRIGSVLSKRKASELSSNGARSKCLSRTTFRRRASQKVSDTSSSEKPLSSMFRSVKSLNKYHRLKKTTDIDVGTQKTRRRKRKKRKNEELDETARLQRRTRYLLIKMKLEQNLIDAYSGEGWNGQSREKIKPEKELQRAKKQILKCKLGIRDAIRQLEALSSEGRIEDSLLGPGGSVAHEHIFCSKCKLRDAFPDNDIILCDGTCNCAFHQKCLEPPLATENIPPDEQGWYCKFCECKIEILEVIDAHLGTRFSPNSTWQDIFLEAANVHDCEDDSLYPSGDWPSDDSGDVDYDPGRNDRSCSYGEMGSEENVSGDASSSGSLFWTSKEEDDLHSGRIGADGIHDSEFYGSGSKPQSSDKIVGDTNSSDGSTEYSRRQRRDVDYKKLHDEMFGKDLLESEEISDDEDWGPSRRKCRKNEADKAGTEIGVSDVISIKNERKFRSNADYKRKLFRIPPDAVKQLREVFAEDELPARVIRENLSKQLGIALEKINKWFKNARYAALKLRKDLQEEKTKHSTESTGVTKISTTQTAKIKNSVVVASSDHPRSVPSTTRTINLRKVGRKRNSKLIITPSRKTKEMTTGVNEGRGLLSKSASLKSQIGSLKSKVAEEKRVKSTCSGDREQPYMVELERIFCLEERLEKMKNILSGIHNQRNNTDQKEASVVYVPIAELREKT